MKNDNQSFSIAILLYIRSVFKLYCHERRSIENCLLAKAIPLHHTLHSADRHTTLAQCTYILLLNGGTNLKANYISIA